jgi:hypothetical protein
VDKHVLSIFQFEVEFQCKCVLAAADMVDAQLAAGNGDGVWFALQSLLIAAANLSKLFWGSGGSREDARLDLRQSVGVEDDSPLRDPKLRNDFEHFDERVEDWFGTSQRHNFMGRNIGPHSAVVGIDEKDRFQWYDPSTGVVTFWTRSVALPLLMAEVRRILPVVQRQLHGPPLRERRCGTCGNLIPQCTCLDAEGNPLRWE